MRRTTTFGLLLGAATLALPALTVGATGDHPDITPDHVEENVALGGHFDVDKTVHTPELPPAVDVCLLEDETGSFANDIANLQGGTTAIDIFNGVTVADKQFAVAGFRDYPVAPHGGPFDHVYRSLSTMSPALASWLAGIAALSAGGGADGPEAQYDAIVAALGPGQFNDPTLGLQNPCGFRYGNPLVTHILVVTTDAPFHLPGGVKPHVNDGVSTLAALNAAGGGKGVVVLGLTAPGAGGELGALAAGTGGSTQALSSSGDNIAQAILDGIADIEIDVSMTSNCDTKTGGVITTDFAPAVQTVTSGDDAFFTETIWVAGDAEPGTYHCEDWALVNGEPMTDAEGNRIVEEKWITVVAATCDPTENPHGKKQPQAPGNGGQGQNQDGFYVIGSTSGEDVFVLDDGSGVYFGPFATGTEIKYTEDDDATPTQKPMGGNNGGGNGNALDTDWHIIGNGDAHVVYFDMFGNRTHTACLVPPPPK